MGFLETKQDDYDSTRIAKQAANRYTGQNAGTMGVDPNAAKINYQNTQALDALGQQAQARQAQQIAAAQFGKVGMTNQNQWENQQRDLASMLQQRAMGQGVSPAEMQMRQAMGQASAEQRSMVAGASGANRALAARQAANNIGQIQGNLASQGAQLRAQEQMQAQQALGGLLGQGREQALGAAGMQMQNAYNQAQMNQQANLANQQAGLQQAGLNDQMTQYLMSQGFTRDQAEQQGQIAMQQLMSQNYATAMGAQQQVTPGWGSQLFGPLMSAGGMVAAGALMKSDKSLKTNIKAEAEKVDDMIRKLKPYSYEYKKGKGLPEGKQIGIMAQDLEKSELGKTLVFKDRDGTRSVDTVRGYGAVLAALRRIDERLSGVESGKKKAA